MLTRRLLQRLGLLAGLALTIGSFEQVAVAQTITINDADRVLFVGDSTSNAAPALYAWYDGGFTDAVNAGFSPKPARQRATATGTVATFTGTTATVASVTPPGAIVILNGGQNGDTAAGVDARIAALMTSTTPQDVFIAVGTNDIAGSTDPNAFATSYASVLTKIKTANPTVRIACMAIYMRGESWDTGPVWVDNGFPAGTNASVDLFDGKISTACSAAGGVYVDTRTQFLPWEASHNPTKGLSGVATVDGVHMTATGKSAISTMALPSVSVQAN